MRLLTELAAVLRLPETRPIGQVEEEIRDELDFHLAMRTEENLKQGLSPDAAHADALRRFGDLGRVYRDCRRTLLGERIMLQRLQTLLMVVLLAAVAALGLQFYRWRQNQDALIAQMSQALERITSGTPDSERNALSAAVAELQPPKVVKTEPAAGAASVDPAISEIVVTFNKTMADESWSWVETSKDTFPETTGEPYYRPDHKTCVLPVKLQPGKSYEIWINTDQYQSFCDETDRPATPHLLRFTTRP
jgi:hypothetical protein